MEPDAEMSGFGSERDFDIAMARFRLVVALPAAEPVFESLKLERVGEMPFPTGASERDIVNLKIDECFRGGVLEAELFDDPRTEAVGGVDEAVDPGGSDRSRTCPLSRAFSNSFNATSSLSARW
jgi:hypothetical protein